MFQYCENIWYIFKESVTDQPRCTYRQNVITKQNTVFYRSVFICPSRCVDGLKAVDLAGVLASRQFVEQSVSLFGQS